MKYVSTYCLLIVDCPCKMAEVSFPSIVIVIVPPLQCLFAQCTCISDSSRQTEPSRRRRDVITSLPSDVPLRHLKRFRRQLNDFDLWLSFGVESDEPGEVVMIKS